MSRLSDIQPFPVIAASLLASVLLTCTAVAAEPLAEYMYYQSEDGVLLNALLWEPPTPTKSVMIMVPGFYGSFAGSRHDYRPLTAQLNAKGYAFMMINMRTASDFTDPRLEDCVQDIGGAVKAAKSRGYTDIALFGTSLGGPRAIMYLAATKEPAVKMLGFVASITSPYQEAQLRLDKANKNRLEEFLQVARQLKAKGRGADAVVYENWFPGRAVRMTARGFLNVFGSPADTGIDTTLHGPQITVPSVVCHGTKDELSLPPQAQAIYDSLKAASSRKLIWVEGATHYLESGGIADSYARAISDYVSEVMPARR